MIKSYTVLVDTHAHLNFPDLEKDLEEVINRAVDNGVTKIVSVSSNLTDSEETFRIAEKYPGMVYPAVGIHPQQTDPENNDPISVQLSKLEQLVKSYQAVAVGECGLDYCPAPPSEKERTKKNQISLFAGQIEIAMKYRLPLIIHSREAINDVLRLVEPVGNRLKGVIHCYSGGRKRIRTISAIGLYFGLGGNLTYDCGLKRVAEEIPLEKIVLETDSPWLSPVPFRGLRNEPKNVRLVAEMLAKIKKVKPATIAQITTENARRLFSI